VNTTKKADKVGAKCLLTAFLSVDSISITIYNSAVQVYTIGNSSRICPVYKRVPWNAAEPNPTIATIEFTR